jgi:hypothetical protein
MRPRPTMRRCPTLTCMVLPQESSASVGDSVSLPRRPPFVVLLLSLPLRQVLLLLGFPEGWWWSGNCSRSDETNSVQMVDDRDDHCHCCLSSSLLVVNDVVTVVRIMFVDRHLAAVRVLPVRFRVRIHQVPLFSVSSSSTTTTTSPLSIAHFRSDFLLPLSTFSSHSRRSATIRACNARSSSSYPRTICSRRMRTASAVRLASSRLRAAWISSHVSGVLYPIPGLWLR